MPKIFKDKNNNVLYTGYETSEIVANPTLAGTEATLTGLQVGDTKYAVPQGGGTSTHLYQHFLYIYCSTMTQNEEEMYYSINVSIFNTDDTAFTTLEQLLTYFRQFIPSEMPVPPIFEMTLSGLGDIGISGGEGLGYTEGLKYSYSEFGGNTNETLAMKTGYQTPVNNTTLDILEDTVIQIF